MVDKTYVENEVRMLYKYGVSDKEKNGDKKKLYSSIFKSIEATIKCDIGGMEYLVISREEVKEIIKNIVGKLNKNN